MIELVWIPLLISKISLYIYFLMIILDWFIFKFIFKYELSKKDILYIFLLNIILLSLILNYLSFLISNYSIVALKFIHYLLSSIIIIITSYLFIKIKLIIFYFSAKKSKIFAVLYNIILIFFILLDLFFSLNIYLYVFLN